MFVNVFFVRFFVLSLTSKLDKRYTLTVLKTCAIPFLPGKNIQKRTK